MKKRLILWLCLAIPMLSSCIKDEPLSREADIIEIIVDDPTFIDRSISEDNRIELIMADTADLTKITPILTLTPYATVIPASGTTFDLSNQKEVEYTVTSQNGAFQKKYTLKIGEMRKVYDFEEWTMAGTGKYPFPILTDPTWSNANSGIVTALVIGALKDFERYPTKDTTLCVSGEYAASLQTIKGGKIIGKSYPIFAGNLFRGDFSANMTNPLKSLKLGRNHPQEAGKPIAFKGFYKYTPGPVMTGADGEVIPDRTDEMSMYAAIFRVTKGALPSEEFLDGETILTSKQVVARAEWSPEAEGMIEKEAINGFTEFSIPFLYTDTIDYKRYDYRLTIVCSSSKDGNLYQGAVGSNLLVDDLAIACEPYIKTEEETTEQNSL
ncbi:PCMD domain-containing protein [Bacteroides sp. 51]|uniref:PCMD domain-containing protein n=1 Tax=Bacteroides sp. 51 TaxID=2302938 RepID=UPI0013D20EC7|nr:PCMD domain-containing protein [Bacteroides sp. 51]NDV83210.1 hypothetical protein [Bacteroides sp. 51]